MTQARRNINNINGDHVIIKRLKKSSQSLRDTTIKNTAVNSPNKESYNNLTSMKIAHLNINGLRNKIDILYAELAEYDIICVSETKLSNQVETSTLEISGYNEPIRRDRQFNNGGGLLVYIKNNIHFKRCPDIENPYIENIWIQVSTLNKQFLLGLFYRPP